LIATSRIRAPSAAVSRIFEYLIGMESHSRAQSGAFSAEANAGSAENASSQETKAHS
jgi:hypothetical protein